MTSAKPQEKTSPNENGRLGKLRELGLELWRDKAGFFGMVLMALLVLMAIFAPLLAPHDPTFQDLRARLLPPVWDMKGTWGHVLGTDHLGRDVLSRVIFGSRVSLMVGLSVVLLAGGFGVVLGLIAGYRGGRTDSFIMRWIDTQVAFPGPFAGIDHPGGDRAQHDHRGHRAFPERLDGLRPHDKGRGPCGEAHALCGGGGDGGLPLAQGGIPPHSAQPHLAAHHPGHSGIRPHRAG